MFQGSKHYEDKWAVYTKYQMVDEFGRLEHRYSIFLNSVLPDGDWVCEAEHPMQIFPTCLCNI